MDLIIAAIYFFAISIIILSFINFKLSIALYIAYLILVPYLQFNVAGVPLSYNVINTLLLLILFYHFQIKRKIKLSFKAINPFLFLYLSLLILTLFEWVTPLNVQFNYWRISFMQTCIISFIVWNIALADQDFLIYFKWAFIISISIALVYGLFLSQMDGFNPYTSLITNHFGITDSADIYSTEAESRLAFSTAGKIQSTMIHPMTYGLLLCFMFIIFSIIYSKTKNKIYWILLVFIGFNILISGVRTGIAALTIGFAYFLIRYRKTKLLIWTFVLLSGFIIVIKSNDNLSSLFSTFTDVSGSIEDIKGSSISMRLYQLQGAIEEIKGYEIIGKGYGWNSYYQSLHGEHPTLLAFESLIFIVLCNSGIIGSLIWIIFFMLLFRLNRKILELKIDIFLIDTFIIVYAAYAIGTGEYGYIQIFALYYTFLLAYVYNKQQFAKSYPMFSIKNIEQNHKL